MAVKTSVIGSILLLCSGRMSNKSGRLCGVPSRPSNICMLSEGDSNGSRSRNGIDREGKGASFGSPKGPGEREAPWHSFRRRTKPDYLDRPHGRPSGFGRLTVLEGIGVESRDGS